MAMIGNIVARVGADVRPLQQGLSQAQRSLGQFQSRSNANTRGISSGMVAMGNLISNAFMKIGAEIISFSTDSIKNYNDLISANMGLNSILSAQGKSFSNAQSYLQSYVSDGLIPLADATTAYKTLSAAGYGQKDTEDMMLRLKDASAFNRQASLTMGEAVKSAAEGIKNQNSVLVDNSGITKNLSLMWADYAKKIGVGSDSLTEAQKRIATVNGIMEESKFQIGDAAKLSNTLGGKMMELNSKERVQVSAVADGVGSFQMSVDEKTLYYTADVKMDKSVSDIYPDAPKSNARIIDDLMYRHWDSWDDYSYTHLFYAPVKNYIADVINAIDIIKDEPYDVESFDVNFNGKEVAYSCKKQKGKEFTLSTNTDIYLLNNEKKQSAK